MRKLLTITLIFFATIGFARELSINPTQTNAQWRSVLGSLQAGDIVYLEDGIYTNFQVDIRGNGTATNPIIVQARNPGNVFIEGAIAVRKAGNFITVSGLHFRNGWGLSTNSDPNREAGLVYQFRIGTGEVASNSRLTNSVFDSLFNPSLNEHNRDHDDWWVGLYHGSNNRIDHNYFGFKRGYGVLMFVDPRNGNPNVPSNHVLENNFFGHRPQKVENGVEQIRIGDSERSMFSVGMIIRNNVFYHNNGEIEIISVKSADNIIEGNFVYESRGQFTLRHGDRNTIRNNVFIGNGLSNRSGVRVINAGQRVYNNWFQGLRGSGTWSALSFQMGIIQTHPLNSHHRVINAEVAYNTFVDVQRIEIGSNVSNPPSAVFPPLDSRFRNNIIFNATSSVLPITVLVAGREEGITFEANLHRCLDPRFTQEGFSLRPNLNFVRPAGALFFELVPHGPMDCLPELTGRGGIPSIESHPDITGNPRQRPFTAGAVNVENMGKRPKIPNLYEVGATWFACIRTKYFSRYTSLD
ncbi:MAG: hypothetical protein FWC98_00060 [Bacteroidales bacterium]|nr:hypothetical protein [Bacteroidales bacterium]